jgi:hypothetical protein
MFPCFGANHLGNGRQYRHGGEVATTRGAIAQRHATYAVAAASIALVGHLRVACRNQAHPGAHFRRANALRHEPKCQYRSQQQISHPMEFYQ